MGTSCRLGRQGESDASLRSEGQHEGGALDGPWTPREFEQPYKQHADRRDGSKAKVQSSSAGASDNGGDDGAHGPGATSASVLYRGVRAKSHLRFVLHKRTESTF